MNSSLQKIIISNPKQNKSNKLTIDIVAKLISGSYHISTLTYSRKGLYEVPLTWKSGVDVHTSYHPSGEQHTKLTRGKLFLFPGKKTLGIAKPHTVHNELTIQRTIRQPWDFFRGCERLKWPNINFLNIEGLDGYPIMTKSKSDHQFIIDYRSVNGTDISIEYFSLKLIILIHLI